MKPKHELELQIIEEQPNPKDHQKDDEVIIRTKILEQKLDKLIEKIKK